MKENVMAKNAIIPFEPENPFPPNALPDIDLMNDVAKCEKEEFIAVFQVAKYDESGAGMSKQLVKKVRAYH